MAGQLIKRGENTWLVRVYLGEDPLTGKRRYKNYTFHGNKKDAQIFLNARHRERDLGPMHDPNRAAVSEYLDRWLHDAAKPKLRDRTYHDYGYIIDRYIRPALGHIRIDKLNALTIQEFYTQLREQRGLWAPTVRKIHVVLSSALDQAVRWGLIVNNPAASAELPRSNRGQRREQIRVLDELQALAFLEAARTSRWRALFFLALHTGMRPSEYLGLQWRDVDFDKNLVMVRRVLYRARQGGGWKFEEPKTFGSTRSITVHEDVMLELKAHRQNQDREKQVFADQYTDHDIVFATTTGEPLNSGNLLQRYLRPILKQAGLDEKLTLYSLRHSHCTLLLRGGVHPKIVSERVGHASIQLTLDVYSHVIPSMQQEAADCLAAMLTRDPPEG